jgi:hypothetical protein
MYDRMLVFRLIAFLLIVQPLWAAEDATPASAKEALQAINDFIGTWKGNGAPEQRRPDPKAMWSETVDWAWRFKGDDAWLTINIKNGRFFQSGELHYQPDKKNYRLDAVTKEGKKLVFAGELKDGVLTLDRANLEKKETQRLRMNLAAEGVRFIYCYERKPDGRTLFIRDYMVACTREGESLGARENKKECIITGGLGTLAVSFKGVTYYVCCSGCRDAFNENPEKYIKEFNAKKGQK